MPSFSITASTNDVGITNSRGAVAWNTVVAGTTGTAIDTVTNTEIRVALFGSAAGGHAVQRMYLYFDTGSFIPIGAVVTSASLFFKRGNLAESGTGMDPIHAVLGTFPIGALAVGNFGDLNKASEFCNFNAFGISASPAVTNLSLISTTSYTKMVLITNGDYANVQPSSGTALRMDICSANHATPANRPTLTVTYELPNQSLIPFI